MSSTSSSNNTGSCEGWAHCSEILGFESVMEKMDGRDFPEKEESVVAKQEKTVVSVGLKKRNCFFPPVLTTLSQDGRPRFNLKKLTHDNGRLTIEMANDKAILRCRRLDGRLVMSIVRSDLVDDDDYLGY